MRTTNKIIIALLIIAVLLVSIGYAAIQNITLNIGGTASGSADDANFKVKFLETTEVSDSSKVTATVTNDTNAAINVVGLSAKGQIVTATYTVQNVSTDLSANLSVNTTNNNEEYFVIESNLGKTSLVAGEVTTLTVTIELIKTPITTDEVASIGIGLIAEPVQPGEEGGTSGGGTTGSSNIITAADVTTLDYGATVTNYTAANGVNVGWKIFHSDGENIYLIADDYVPVKDSEGNSYIPTGQGGTAVDTEEVYVYNSSYNFYLTSIAAGTDYTGIADISTSLRTEWLSQYTYTNETYNGKATAYLMDTDQWSGFANSHADYAIGGPTLELFAESYNKTHPDRTIDTQVIASPNDGTYGYQLKWSDEEYDANAYEGFAIDGFNYTTESLYIIGSNEKAYGYWVASPSAYRAEFVMAAVYNEDEGIAALRLTGDDGNGGAIGARPLVSLKSSVQLEKQDDGSYLIVE